MGYTKQLLIDINGGWCSFSKGEATKITGMEHLSRVLLLLKVWNDLQTPGFKDIFIKKIRKSF